MTLKQATRTFLESWNQTWRDSVTTDTLVNSAKSLLTVGIRVITNPWHCLELGLTSILETDDVDTRQTRLASWMEAKRLEFGSTCLAVRFSSSHDCVQLLTCRSMQGTVVASTVTASIQWDQAAHYHWVIHGFWYGSLVLSLFSVIVAFHLTILLGTYELGRGHQLVDALKQTVSDKPKFSAMFIFQAPVMLLSYAIISYVVGLSVAVLRPLWTVPWNDEHKVR